MMKAVFNISNSQLIIIGDEIKTLVKIVEEMGEWDTVCDLEGKPLYDIQLDFDDSIDTGDNPELNPKNFNLQYVNLVKGFGDFIEQGHDWQNIELMLIRTEPFLEELTEPQEITITFEGKEYVIADKFEDGSVVISKNGKIIKKLDEILDREIWNPLRLKSTK